MCEEILIVCQLVLVFLISEKFSVSDENIWLDKSDERKYCFRLYRQDLMTNVHGHPAVTRTFDNCTSD